MTATTHRPDATLPRASGFARQSTPPPAGRRALTVLAVGLGGGLAGYGLSLLVSGCTSCAAGASPMSFGVLLGVVAGWSAFNATSRR